MKSYLMARGEARAGAEFIYLGEGPRHWWRGYRDYLTVEKPGILLHCDGRRWRVLVTGIGTSLRDLSGRGRPLNLALEGEPGEQDTTLAYAVIAAYLAELGGAGVPPTLGDELQSRFTGETIERLRRLTIVDERPGDAAEEVEHLIREVAGKLPAAGPPGPAPQSRSWAGEVTDSRVRGAALARARTLLDGRSGLWGVFNNTPTVEHVLPLAAEPGGVTALIGGVPPLREIVDLTPAGTGTGAAADPKAPAGRVPARKVIIASVVVAALAVIWWLIRR